MCPPIAQPLPSTYTPRATHEMTITKAVSILQNESLQVNEDKIVAKQISIYNANLRYQGTPNGNVAFSPFECQAFHKDPNKLYIF